MTEPALDNAEAMSDFQDCDDPMSRQLSEADMELFLEAYRISQDELLGQRPLPLPTRSPRQSMDRVEPALGDDTSFPFPIKSVPLTVTRQIGSTQVSANQGRSTSKQTREEPVLAGNKDLIAIRGGTESKHAHQRETDTDVLLGECRA